MKITYITTGTCSKQIIIEINEETNRIIDVCFIGGCPGNTQGLSTLLKNMDVDIIISKLEGIRCGIKSTSCPDQLSSALKQYKELKKKSQIT